MRSVLPTDVRRKSTTIWSARMWRHTIPPSPPSNSLTEKKNHWGISSSQHILCTRYRRRNQVIRLRQRKPPPSPFYYRHLHEGARITKHPLIVPDYQIENLKIICASESQNIIIVPSSVEKFKTGQTVRVIEGAFAGLIGKVARYQGQQRVAIIIDGLLTIASAYVPKAFIEIIV